MVMPLTSNQITGVRFPVSARARSTKDTAFGYGPKDYRFESGRALQLKSMIQLSMDKFKYKITLSVEVEAFDESDAWDALQEIFGTGDEGAVHIIECEYKLRK